VRLLRATKPAPVGRRVAAKLIDFAVFIALVAWPVRRARRSPRHGGGDGRAVSGLDPGLNAAVWALAVALEPGVQTVSGGRTLGQAALGIRVARAGGGDAEPVDLFVRAFGPEAALLPVLALLPASGRIAVSVPVRAASAICLLVRSDRRALTDLLARTTLVRHR
jgi:uncharacterized RDD family membrane protein YckC